jgi:hypothetical protein
MSVTLPVIALDAPGEGDGEGLGFGDGDGEGDGNGEGDGDGFGVAVGVGVGFGEPWLTEPQPAIATKYANEINTLRYKGTFPLGFMNNLLVGTEELKLTLEMSSSSSELARTGASTAEILYLVLC